MKIIGFGEIMIRFTSFDINNENEFEFSIGGAEYNVIANLASMGMETSFLTKIPDNQLGKLVITNAKKYGIETKHIVENGEKLGSYYAFVGNEIIPTNIVYDRKHSEFYFTKEFAYKEILKDYDILHISGVVPAINENTRKMAIDIIKCAHELGIKISYDSNYRGKLWSQIEAGSFLQEILSYCNILFLGILDIKFLLKYDTDDLVEGYEILLEKYPNIELLASTNRNIITQINHEISGNVFDSRLFTSRTYNVNIIDRIGTGDSFTAGVLYGYMNKYSSQKTVEFAMANGVIKHYMKGDNYMANVDAIENVVNNIGSRIDR